MLALGAAGSASATTKVWNNSGGGSWQDPDSWSPGGVPTASDDVFISLNGTYSVTVDGDATYHNLTVGGGTGVQTLDWLTGTLGGFNAEFKTNGVLNLAFVGSSEFSGALTNSGHINLPDGGPQNVDLSNARIDNGPGGVFDLQQDAYLSLGTGTAVFVNSGILRKSDGGGLGGFSTGVTVTNLGLVDIQSGQMQFLGGFTSSSTFTVATGAAIDLVDGVFYFNAGHIFTGLGFYGVQGGTPTINGTIVNTNFQLAAGTLTANCQITGVLRWLGGALAGTPTVAVGGTLNITTQSDHFLSGVITNRGRINWLNDGPDLLQFSNGKVENVAGATFDVQGDGLFSLFGGTAAFNNVGTLLKSTSIGDAGFDFGIAVTNTGTIDAQLGGLYFTNGVTSSGTINAGTAGAVYFSGGTVNLAPASTFTGPGFYGVTVGTVTLTGPVAGTNFQFTGGRLQGNSQINGVLQWKGGTLAGAPTVAASGTLNIATTDTKIFTGVLTNLGTIHWQPDGPINLTINSGRIQNQLGALFDLQTDGNFVFGTGANTFTNVGTLRKSGGSGVSGFSSNFPLVNTGTIDAQTGTILLPNAYTQTGGQLNVGISGPTTTGVIYFNAPAALTGTLSANAIGGYQPAEGATFTIVRFPSSTGSFTSVGLFAPPLPDAWRLDYNADNLTITTYDASPPNGPKAWVNPAGGAWSSAVNWNPPGIPGPGHDVTIDLNGSYSVNISTGAVFKTLMLGGGNGTKSLDWTGGPMTGDATVAVNGLLTLTNSAARTWTGIVTNYGRINWSVNGPGSVSFVNARIDNLNGALFDLQMNGQFNWGLGVAAINNSGTFRKSGGGGLSAFNSLVILTNIGTVDIQSGSLLFSEGFVSSGTFNVAAGAGVNLALGTFKLNPGHNFSGPGFYGVSSGTPVINGPIVNTNFQFTGGIMAITNQITGVLQWYGGLLTGEPTVAANGVINLGTSGAKILTGVLTNAGRINWLPGSSPLLNFNNGRLENRAGAVFDVQLDGTFNVAGGTATFNNAGTVLKSAGTGTAAFGTGFAVTNFSLFDVQNGTFQLPASYVQNGGRLNVGIAGPTTFGKFAYVGTAALQATLSASSIGGYQPTLSSAFNVITYPSFTGSFAVVNPFALTTPNGWQTSYGANGVTLTVVDIRPVIATSFSPGNLTVSWPVGTDPGFVLQSATNLADVPIKWTNVGTPVVPNNGQNTVTIPTNGVPRLFIRLLLAPP